MGEKRKRKTKDEGNFIQELKAPRRTITIKDKLMVLDMYEKILQEKREALEQYQEPRQLKMTAAQQAEWSKRRKVLRKKMKRSAQVECRKMHPDIIGRAQLCKWHKAAQLEKWRELPEQYRARFSATNNKWRKRIGCALKGKKLETSSTIPRVLQQELDMLMVEHCTGLSSISERKEIVSTEQAVPWFLPVLMTEQCRICF